MKRLSLKKNLDLCAMIEDFIKQFSSKYVKNLSKNLY